MMKRLILFFAATFLALGLLIIGGVYSCGGGSDLVDKDGDGWLPTADCDDSNSAVHPLAEEIPYNDVDEDCDGVASFDADNDGYNKEGTTDLEGNVGTDCDDGDSTIHPDAREIPYDNIDQDCDGLEDDGDGDGDNYSSTLVGGDDCCDSGLEASLGCTPANAADIHPGAAEISYDGIDQNCDGLDYGGGPVQGDDDGDGFAKDSLPGGIDCDDNDPDIHPGAPERCNYLDDDCDGLTDEDLIDLDHDGCPACLDCDDYDPQRFPGTADVPHLEVPYNDIDEDCDGLDITDVDGDGQDAIVAGGLDCNDNDPEIYDGAPERCNHIDDDCDGDTDEDFIQDHTDGDLDGWLGGGDGACPDCNDGDANISPVANEVTSDGIDNDCDDLTDETDADSDGYLVTPAPPNPQEVDCCDAGTEVGIPGCDLANRAGINPGATELAYDGIDQDCDGADLTDVDGDGHDAVVAGGDDCDDANPEAYPGHAEVCSDPADNNCDGVINEDCGPGTGEEVVIEAGAFTMGRDITESVWNPDQQPQHLVNLTAYNIDKYEVTVADYRRCVAHGICNFNGMGPESYSDEHFWENQARGLHPAIEITWIQANTYCQWVGKVLPSEAQWEKAARGSGNSTQIYPWGDPEYQTDAQGHLVPVPVSCDMANHTYLCTQEQCHEDVVEVDQYEDGISPYGLFNMAGNAREWVADWYDAAYYQTSPADDPPGPINGSEKVVRGGGFRDVDGLLEVPARYHWNASSREISLGFRCARVPPP
jgi:formylglycine-generating enzyme required for sulfatase activity